MDILLYLDAVSLQHNLKGLRHLFDLVESHVRGLKSPGISPEAYGSLLPSVLINKLPSEFRLISSRDVKDDEWDLNALMTVMEREIEARERAVTGPSVLPKRQSRDPPTAAVLLTRESGPTCSYCSQSHSSNTYRTVTNVETRKQILKKAGRCFVCLRRHHISRDCRSGIRCVHCNGRHHNSICTHKDPSPRLITTPSTTTHQDTPSSQMSHIVSMCINSRTPVLLQMAKTLVYNPQEPHNLMKVRLILDNGSQTSYISNKVRGGLGL